MPAWVGTPGLTVRPSSAPYKSERAGSLARRTRNISPCLGLATPDEQFPARSDTIGGCRQGYVVKMVDTSRTAYITIPPENRVT